MAIEEQSSLDTLKQNLIEYVQLQLASQIIDIELDAEHYEAAYQKTIGVYRQRAQGAYEESYTFMELVRDINIYTLPQETILWIGVTEVPQKILAVVWLHNINMCIPMQD